MVRDPIARIEAHWVHNYAKRRERGTVIETITHPNTTYVLRSRYFMQLEQFLQYFDRSRILVFQQSDLRDRRDETLREVFEFVGIDPDFEHKAFDTVRHRTVEEAAGVEGGDARFRSGAAPTSASGSRRSSGTTPRAACAFRGRSSGRTCETRCRMTCSRAFARTRSSSASSPGRDFANWSIWT